MEEKRKTGSFRVICDEEKQRQVPHWDMDYLSREDLDAAFGCSESASEPPPAAPDDKDERD